MMYFHIHPSMRMCRAFIFGLWMAVGVSAAAADPVPQPQGKTPYEIGTRLELFVDDFMIETMTGDASRRMHHPEPREIVHTLDKPWEGKTSAYLALVQDGALIRIYYNASPRFRRQAPAVIESHDGINFWRPQLGIVEFEGSTDNNLLPQFGTAGHHFTPFIDTNPDAVPDARYKAFARGPGGMRFYASPDGIDWRRLEHNPEIEHGDEDTRPASDTQNLAFWDPVRARYVAYLRLFRPHRCIRYATSPDLVNWTKTLPVEYDDHRDEHLYTNGIRPYDRAPHIYIGLPNRFVTGRRKVAAHPNNGINEVVLMSSRDGVRFQRWPEAFVRPGPDPEVWTDRNNYPAWGLARTSPTELSMYWTEHYRHAGMRFRRGVIRVDGFVSVHAGSAGGGMLTRPLIFSGDRLVVNYRTSAAGEMRFELTDESGAPIPGFALSESEELFGNAVEHLVTWRGGADLAELIGRPVRLRVHLRDADLYAIRFEPAGEIRARLAAEADEARALLADPLPDFAVRDRQKLQSALDEYEQRLDRDRQLTRQATLESGYLIRRALHAYRASERLAAAAREALDAAAALDLPQEGFGAHYRDMLNALCAQMRAALVDAAAGPAGLQSVLTRCQGVMQDIDRVTELRHDAAGRLAEAGAALDASTAGFGVLLQAQVAARRDALDRRLADAAADIATVARAADALAEAAGAFQDLDEFPAVVPAGFTGTPPVYAEKEAADWMRGMRVNLVVEDDDLTLVAGATMCFDVDPSRVEFPVDDALKSPAFTVEAWVKLQDPDRRWTPVVRMGSAPEDPPPRDGWTNIAWSIWLNGLRPQAVVRIGADDSALARTRLGPSLELNRWHHLAASFDGAAVKLFIDGEPAAQVEQAGVVDYTWSETLVIGGDPNQRGSSYNNFRGRIRDVRLWDHARDPTDIQDDRYRQLDGGVAGLVGYWIAGPGAGAGDKVFDLTGRGNHGRLADARWLPASGYRIMGPIRFPDSAPAVAGLRVAWQATLEGDAALEIDAGISDSPHALPDEWRGAVNDVSMPLPDAADQAASELYGWIRQTMSSDDPAASVRLHALTIKLD